MCALPGAGPLPMIVCLCHRVSDRDIAREVRSGCASFDLLQDELRVATACGACTECARETFAQCQMACGGTPAHRPTPAALPAPARTGR